MNERIHEMMMEATKAMPQGYYVPGEYFQKFAELIVRECAGLLEKEAESSHDEATDTYNLLIRESSWMKKHFGVEE